MPLFGSHLSISGGYFKAVDAAGELGMDCVQLFTKNNNQWAGKPITAADIKAFRDAIERTGLRLPCAHDSYLINIASADETLWQKSVDALTHEVERAESLGLAGVVMHPGAAVGASEAEALQRIIISLNEVHRRTPGVATQLWLETTAGQGTTIGDKFEQLAALIDGVDEPERLGVCVDTCHIFAAGYPLQTPEDYQETFNRFDALIGTDRIRAFHLNDSKKPFGSRVDRHEHIGEGHLGLEPFRHVLNDPRFAAIPMYLETEKGDRDGEPLDAINLRTLRSLLTEPKVVKRKKSK